MARLIKVVTVTTADDKPLDVMIKELTVGEIIDLMNDEAVNTQTGVGGFGDLQSFLTRNLEKFTNLKFEQVKQLAPSDLKKLYEAFKEVNAAFFDVARQAGLLNLLAELKTAVVEDFSRLLVGSLKRGTAKVSLDTGTASSSMPSTST